MKTRYDKNIQIFMRIIDPAVICARQGITLRIHRDNLDDPLVSFFVAILIGFANMDDTNLLKWTKKCKNVFSENSE